MKRAEFVSRLDERLRTGDFADVDASPNGLQVGSAEGEVEHVAFAVDAAAETIDRADEAGADVLVTHHGLIWDGIERITDRDFERIDRLLEAGMALYVSHLPLDAHPELGNAAGLADYLGVADREPFGAIGPEHVGVQGALGEPADPGEIKATLAESLDHGAGGMRHLDFGPGRVERVAILTGSGVDWLDEAVEAGADALVTGEGKQRVYHEAREAGIHVYLAGHYATETFGVRSLQSLAEEWGLETTFVDAPTGL